jgi:hypothetical protein
MKFEIILLPFTVLPHTLRWIKAKISLVYLKFRKIRAFFNVYTFGIRFLLKFFKYPVPCYPDYLPFENCYHKIKFRWSAQTRRKHSTFFHKVVFRIYYILWLNKKISDSRMAVPNPLLILYICSYAWLPVLLFLSNFSVAPATGARSISILGLWWEPPTKEEILIKHFARRFSQFITEMKWIQWLVRLRIWDAHQNVVLNILFIMLLGGTLMAESRSMVLQRFRTIGHEPNHISTRYYTGSVSGKVRYLKKIKK